LKVTVPPASALPKVYHVCTIT